MRLLVYVCARVRELLIVINSLFKYNACRLKVIMNCCREEIQRIKAGNPDISHREAFSAAAKNVRSKNVTYTYILSIYIYI